MPLWKAFRPGDYLILGISLVLIVGSGFYAFRPGGGEPRVEIETPQGTFLYPLGEPRNLKVRGSQGDSLIKISDQGAQFLESPCSNQHCVHQGIQKSDGAWAACLPNRIMIRIQGNGLPGGADVGSY